MEIKDKNINSPQTKPEAIRSLAIGERSRNLVSDKLRDKTEDILLKEYKQEKIK